MTVTTGGRCTSSCVVSADPCSPSSTSDSETRRARCPNSWTTSSAVSASIVCVIVAMMPSRIRTLMTSGARVAMRLASSCTVICSGRITSRTTRTWSERSRSSSACRRSRSRWRRTEARLRTRSSSPSIAACTSMRPARRWSAPFLGVATCGLRGGRVTPGRRTGRASSSSSRPVLRRSVAGTPAAGTVAVAARRGVSVERAVATGAAEGVDAGVSDMAKEARDSSSPALRANSSSACRRASSAWRSASSSAALRASSSALRRASSAAERIEIFSCSRRSASRRAFSRCCSTSAR